MTTLLERVRAAGIEVVHLQFTDVAGSIKSLTIPASRLERTLEAGAWFDGSSLEGLDRTAESDLYLRPEPDSFVVLPWEPTPSARLICDVCLPGGAPFPADPRQALKGVLAEALELGFDYRVSVEFEFFVFEDRDGVRREGQPLIPVDRTGYFEMQNSRAAKLCRETIDALASFGVEVEASHAEVGPGQHEIDLAEHGALQAADAVMALKWVLRSLARRRDAGQLHAQAAGGCAWLWAAHLASARRSTRRRRFLRSVAPVSALHGRRPVHCRPAGARARDGGGRRAAGELLQTPRAGSEAPSRVTWARIHRGALLRVPEPSTGRGTRLELRAPDPSCNPYLALAVMLKTGLDGIRGELPLPPPGDAADDGSEVREDNMANPLPATLGEAIEELNWDPVVREALGQPIFERFLTAKEREWTAFGRHISHWELDNYLEGA